MGTPITCIYQFLSGAAMFGALVCGVHFIRSWVQTRDRLFLFFALAFWFMAIERIVLAFMPDPTSEDRSLVYLFRLAGFLLIIFAVIDKNRKDQLDSR